MLNKDLYNQEKEKALEGIMESIKNDDADALGNSFNKFCQVIEQRILDEAAQCMDTTDTAVLAARGVRQLTNEEKKYYEKLTLAMRDKNPQQAIANIDVALPRTVVDAVFEELIGEHEILNEIEFFNASGIVEYIYNKADKQLASWGVLTAEIVKEITGALEKKDITQKKLSAFFLIPQSMLDLGPVWIDRYIRTLLSEAIAYGLEEAVIAGTGKDMPIGMMKQVGEGVSVTGGVYPDKEAIAVTDFTPKTYGNLVSQLAVNPITKKPRRITNLILVVNQVDYYNKIMPATTKLTDIGTYIGDIFPVPTKVIQSEQVPQGKAVMGIGKKYTMPVGIGSDGKIEYDDSYKFLEDERTYKVKVYGDGFPKDNNAFLVLDITNLAPLDTAAGA